MPTCSLLSIVIAVSEPSETPVFNNPLIFLLVCIPLVFQFLILNLQLLFVVLELLSTFYGINQ